MLKLINRMGEMSFSQLMQVYAEGNRQNGAEQFPEYPQEQQLFQAEQAFYQYLRDCFFTVPGAVYAVYLQDGRYVSALRLEPYKDGLLLEALETKPEERRKGHGYTLLSQVLREYPREKIYSHVHKKNLPSLKLHEKCGFFRISEQASYIDGSVNNKCCTMLFHRSTQ